MAHYKFAFLDFDETLSDPFLLHHQYVRSLGAFLAERYGGEADRWAKAAIDTLEKVEREYNERFVRNPLGGYRAWLAEVRERSARGMFEQMGIGVPLDIVKIARESQYRALLRCNAAFPYAEHALTQLQTKGWRIYIASGQESDYLEAALKGAGIAGCIERKFGPDLVDCAKEGPEFFERIFASVGTAPQDAVVVDDWPPAIEWALQAGAAVIQSKQSRVRNFEVVDGVSGVMTDLRDLPRLVDQAARLG